ncbi:MAG: hypothetical protein KF824_11895 [Fimbriimonadaceae bacterium]|nr:MAG: hypothetical protein KF824_11895 [Fimbriimonadaceae bacterium]
MNWRWLSSAVFCLGLAGCSVIQLPDPNDMGGREQIDPEIMQRNIALAYQDLGLRVKRGEINEAQKEKLIRELAENLASYIKLENIPDHEAYRYADVLRQANRLAEAKAVYETAVSVAKTEDRLVNDSLQLARVMCMMGEVKPAIDLARTTFTASPKEKAPILLSVLYEIVPAGKDKGHDVELGDLLLDAIDQQMLVEVDPESDAGKAFLDASQVHVAKAWQEAMKLYNSANREDLMRKAIERRDAVAKKFGNF